jgi:hypothetical protein
MYRDIMHSTHKLHKKLTMHNMHNNTAMKYSNLPRSRYEAPILIFGCGNILMGDDGFGPAGD